MKTLSILFTFLLFLIIGCGQSTNETQDNEVNAPGPVTQADRDRYNLNAHDELNYGSMDSVMRDSLRADSLIAP